MRCLQMDNQTAVPGDVGRYPTEIQMTNPYAPPSEASDDRSLFARQNLALLASVVLATFSIIAFSLDTFNNVALSLQFGDTKPLYITLVCAFFPAASLLMVCSEFSSKRSLKKTAAVALVLLFLYSVYRAVEIRSDYLAALQAKPTDTIALMLPPVIWVYSVLVAIRAIRTNNMQLNG